MKIIIQLYKKEYDISQKKNLSFAINFLLELCYEMIFLKSPSNGKTRYEVTIIFYI